MRSFLPSVLRRSMLLATVAPLFLFGLPPARSSADVIWTEGEKPAKSNAARHPWWYDKVHTEQLSGGDFISNWGDKPAEISYVVAAPKGGDYDFWVRANPIGTKLAFKLNDADWTEIDLAKDQRENTNLAADDKPDLRFLAWERVGKATLKKGDNAVAFRMHSDNNNHGMLDCFVFSSDPFTPHGIKKPGDPSVKAPDSAEAGKGWFAFEPQDDPFKPNSAIDLRSLNEKAAGDGGYIGAKDGHFIHSHSGKTIRFWGVNGPPDNLASPEQLRECARILAKHGVNLVRLHAPPFDADGKPDPAKIDRAIAVVEAMKSEGIYTDFSIYWYSFITPKPDSPFLIGYDGKKNPHAALFFNADFQKQYRAWWTALLTTPSKATGKKLIDEPALASVEMQNEDSLFFWTFSDGNIPDLEMRIIEKRFGDWLGKKYGSLEAAIKQWNGLTSPRDNIAEGRIAFRPLYNLAHERVPRDKDTAAFMAELQRGFYQDTYQFLRKLGFKGALTTSGWTTADPQYLGPIDKYTNTVADYVDRHGYFGGVRQGPNEGWAIMNTQTYADRSALRFEADAPGKGKLFVNPVMDPHYDNKPSMISETAFERPNRYRSEGPLYYACYGALQDSGGFDMFALDGDRWSVKPGYFMQPWTLMTPATMGQYPAAALIFREGLIEPGEVLVNLNLKIADVKSLSGTPMPQDASFDELRLKDVPKGTELKSDSIIDPLVYYAGRTRVNFTESGGPAKLVDLASLIDHKAETVASSNHQLNLDYGKGVVTIDAPSAQGMSGNLKAAGPTDTKDLSISSELELGHIIVVSLDNKPLATSGKMLVQVMSEEQSTGFLTEGVGNGLKRIADIGRDPWLVKDLEGTIKFKRADAAKLKVTALDYNGYTTKQVGAADALKLSRETLYYLVAP